MKVKFLIITILFCLIGKFMIDKNKVAKNTVVFGIPQIAFSSDPLDFDYISHHYAFSSVFAKLVAIEKLGTVNPALSSSWSNRNNFQEWTFKIKDNLTYSNGDKIVIDDIKLNFKRLVYLNNKNHSKSGVLEFLEGFTDFHDISGELIGLVVSDNNLILKFTKPMPDLLDKISFGFYGLAHPSLYDKKTGVWFDKKRVVSSGPYIVKNWNDSSFVISLRDDVEIQDREKRLKEIKFIMLDSIKKVEDVRGIDFLVADRQSLLVTDDFEYVGSAEKLKIGYVRVHSALKENSPFQNIEIRKWFRHKFYLGLEKNNFPITGSFFPETLRNIKPIVMNHYFPRPDFEHFTILSDPFTFPVKLEENKHKKSITEIFSDAINELGNDSGASLHLEIREDEGYDLEIRGTGIDANNYWDTVNFMFFSKEGILLPDITGVIKKELQKSNPDINIINQELWDQAVIWPIRHYTSGYWFNKKSGIDYSEINFNSPTIDFQFLKWK
jgi:hypothetical protein